MSLWTSLAAPHRRRPSTTRPPPPAIPAISRRWRWGLGWTSACAVVDVVTTDRGGGCLMAVGAGITGGSPGGRSVATRAGAGAGPTDGAAAGPTGAALTGAVGVGL